MDSLTKRHIKDNPERWDAVDIWCERCGEREATDDLGDALFCRGCAQDTQRELDRADSAFLLDYGFALLGGLDDGT